MYEVYFTKQALKDLEKLKAAKLSARAKKLVDIIQVNPFQTPPPYEKLVGNLHGFYSKRINIQHRLIYEVLDNNCSIKVLRMWVHYE